eukprot:COSAG05_NODE_17557_length_323_cov_0.919643_1_plen_38_part_10
MLSLTAPRFARLATATLDAVCARLAACTAARQAPLATT